MFNEDACGERLRSRGKKTFSIKGQTVNIFSFAGHVAFVTVITTQLCHCSAKATLNNV